MAAFHTNVLRNGEWVTEVVDANTALKASIDAKPKDGAKNFETSPFGILSRTIVHNPKVNLILPACLRSKDHNDIAFIGDQYIHIREQRGDGQQVEVLPHHHFDSRIRNAVVIGTPPTIGGDTDDIKTESLDHDVDMPQAGADPKSRILPPQILVLALETGELCFVFIESEAGGANLKLFTKNVSPPADIPFLGHHLSIDPSFRYLALASPDEMLMVYHLKSLDRLTQEYGSDGTFEPVLERHCQLIRAVIHSVNFLYPRPQDDYHIILILTVCNKDQVKSRAWRMHTFDWEAGERLASVFQTKEPPKKPLRLPELPDIPSFLIPLRFQSTFFMVFRSHICLVKQALSVPEYEFTPVPHLPKSGLHYGAGEPLWTAWARPFRRKSYTQNTDIIYLAREDGIVIHLELELDSMMYSVTQIGSLDINIGRAFTAAYDIFSDLLIIGGDAGPGGVWKLPARSEFQKVSSIPNWSPVIDAVTTEESPTYDAQYRGKPDGRVLRRSRGKPDQLFLATRRGARGSLVEPRIGMQARIGLDMDFGEPTREAWMFPDIRQRDGSSQAIIALPHSSAVLCFSPDFKDVHAETEESTSFDLSSRTIFVTQSVDDMIIQVTETSITLVTPSQSSRHTFENILAIPGPTAHKAHCVDDVILTYIRSDLGSHICTLNVDQMAVSQRSVWQVHDSLHCVSLLPYSTGPYVISGSLSTEHPYLSIFSLDGDLVAQEELCVNDDSPGENVARLEALTSFVVVQETNDGLLIAAGTRCGHLVTAHIKGLPSQVDVSWTSEQIGTSSVYVFPGTDTHPGAFCCCDEKLLHLSRPSSARPSFEGKDLVYPIDLNDSWANPTVHSVFSLQSGLNRSTKGGTLLLLAGTKILLAEFCADITSVPRMMDLPGPPTKMMYSHFWRFLAVGVQIGDRPTLVFIEPDTGETISRPVDKDQKPVDFINGLGQPGDRICGIYEWIFVKDGSTFPFLIVTTQEGSLLIVSVLQTSFDEVQPPRRVVEYFTRYRKKGFKDPVYSVVADDESLVYCAGQSVFWDTLDLEDKRMKPVDSMELDSPATLLSLLGTHVLALTARHSLEVADRQKTDGRYELVLAHTDSRTRATCHMIMVGPDAGRKPWPVNLISDLSGGITGLWVPAETPHKDLVRVFEGRLKSSVRRFVRGNCRQPWSNKGRSGHMYGSIQSTVDDGDVLGVSLNGTVQQFKLLGLDLWRVMFLIQALAVGKNPTDILHISVLRRHWGEKIPREVHAGLMHVDGDVLMDCLQSRSLERLVTEADLSDLFFFCLDELEDGVHTRHIVKDGDESARGVQYFELAYEILEYLLSSAL